MDVVYHLGTGSRWHNGELRFSLRALERNFRDLGKVYVVGFKPKWLTGVVHIPLEDKHKHNKDANLIDKVLAACRAGVSDQFIRSSDDELLWSECCAADIKPYHAGDLQTKTGKFWNSGWKNRLQRTMEYLKSIGATTLHFDTHVPKVYDRELFMRIAGECDYAAEPGYTIDTLYLNQAGLIDPPQIQGEKLTLERRGGGKIAALRTKVAGRQYLGYNDAGLTDALKSLLLERFPVPSRFETGPRVLVSGTDFSGARKIPTVVAVVGTGRSGTSCTAGIVHHLGISMGDKLREPTHVNPRGFFEAMPLRDICREKISRERRIKKFRTWAIKRGRKGASIIGGKYAMLCEQLPEMAEAWPDLRVIAVDRPMSEIVPSMMRAGLDRNYHDAGAMERLATKRINARDRDLKRLKINTLRLNYHDILSDPAGTVDKIVAFTGIAPTEEQRASAVAFVDPSLRHNGK